MSPNERWQRVQELAERLEAVPDPEREALAARDEPDESLRDEALGLCRSLAQERATRAAFAKQEAELPPRIGIYTIQGVLGRGGTSTVYAAERIVNGIVQPVALKLLHAYLADQEALARFQSEQALLTRIDHPAICRVLDAGVTSSQQPYLVLDRIEGKPIDRFADENKLGIEDRIRLVVECCDAIAAAHRSFIAHLDLKPANVFVAAGGRVRLLDFGTAKLIDPGGSLTATRHLTPLYAAPEQLRGEPVSTASDIYSLGMVLYELLAGAHPFEHRSLVAVAERASGGTTTLRMAERVTEESARARGLTVSRLRATLRGDIEAVVAKALAPDPARRYASAGEFAGDLQRYLERRPVLAQRPTLLYRLRKYAARHRAPLVAAGLLALALGAAAAYGYREQQRALAEGRRAETTAYFLLWLLQSANPIYGGDRQMTVSELARRASERLERGDLRDPILTAHLESTIGNYLFQAGQERAAVETLERARTRARDARSAAALVSADAALSMVHLSRGDCASGTNASAEAEDHFRRYRKELPVYLRIVHLVNRSQILSACANDTSGELMRQAVSLLPRISEETLGLGMPAPLFKALVLNGAIRTLVREGKPAEARSVAEEAMGLAARSPDGRNVKVALLQSRAAAEYAAKDVAAAARSLEEAAGLAEAGAAPFEAIRLKVMAGQRLAEAGQTERAVGLAEEALRLAEARAAELTQTRWMILVDAAITFFRAGRCERTQPLLDEADRLTAGRMPPRWKGNRLAVECFCLARAGKAEAAKARAAEAIAAAGATWPPASSFRKKVELVLQTGKD